MIIICILTYDDQRDEIDPVPEWMGVLDVVHDVDPTCQTDHLHTDRQTDRQTVKTL